MGCGPQLAKNNKTQCASAVQKKPATDRGSSIEVKINPGSIKTTKQSNGQLQRKQSKRLSSNTSYHSVSFLNIQSVVKQSPQRQKRRAKRMQILKSLQINEQKFQMIKVKNRNFN